jgi:hypothetical protein
VQEVVEKMATTNQRRQKERERESLCCSDTITAVVHFDCDCAERIVLRERIFQREK